MGWRWQQNKREIHPAFWRDARFNAPLQPVVGVNWYETLAYTRWFSQETGISWRLPAEVEWEAAARNPNEPDKLPEPQTINSRECSHGCAWPVDGRGAASWCGACDMLGNIWEWVSTRWGRNWQTLAYPYPYNPDDGRGKLSGSYARIIRGGSWYDPSTAAHPSSRARYLPGSRASNIGFRLAHSL